MARLTDRKIKTAKPPTEGHIDLFDSDVRGFGIRISYHGRRTFVLVARYPGSTNPTRRALGTYPAISLAEAREKAREWRKLVERGKDPSIEEARQRAAEQRRQAMTFATVAEDFIANKLPGERKGREVERDIRRTFIAQWGGRPISDITAADVREIIRAKARTAKPQARNLLGYAKRLFAWAVDEECYDLTTSPAAALKPLQLIGEKIPRGRILSDRELVALYHAASGMGYPHGTVYLVLLYTGLRLNEAADAHSREVDLPAKLWVIPPERMKAKNSRARPHAVPLTDEMLILLRGLPRFTHDNYLFSIDFGKKPVWMSSKVKERLDREMLIILRADDPKARLEPWINHDIRRTVRSNLSRLKVSEEAREAVMAHVRPGIKGTYDLYDYLDEKLEALELWAARLRQLLAS